MDTSIFLAQLIGSFYLVYGLGLLISSKFYRKAIADFLDHKGTLMIGGMLAFFMGFLIVSYHNIWESSWVVLVTIFGWAALIKGLFIIIFPKGYTGMASSFSKNKGLYSAAPVLTLVLGIVYGYFGFIA